jgi:hypothetical protein
VRGKRTSPEVEVDVAADRDLEGVVLTLPAEGE